MGLKKRLLMGTIKLTKNILKYEIELIEKKRGENISAELASEFTPIVVQETGCGQIKFFCPGTLPVQRARSLLTKEPITIDWIKTFESTEIFWDIGANIGVYSLFAASRKITVISFEPSPSNFYLLSKNIEANNFDDRISAFCIAFNDRTRIDNLYMQNSELGGSLSTFGEAVDWQGQTFSAAYKKSMLGFSIDDFIQKFNPLFPTHIKIDVDGAEDKIVEGAKETLKDRRLKSVLIELDPKREDYYSKVRGLIESSGMVHSKTEFPRPSKQHKQVSVGNHIFVRN